MLSRPNCAIEGVTGANTAVGPAVERRHGDRPSGADAVLRGKEGLNLSTPATAHGVPLRVPSGQSVAGAAAGQ
jgi:hypothetical protein